MNRPLLTTLILILLGLSLSTSATVIPVSSAADISNATPSPGDTLLLSKSANWANQDIVADFTGTASNPITLLAEGNGEVILSGGATLQIAGSYVIVNGLTFRQCASNEGGDLVKFRTSSSNVAQNCRLTNCFFSDNNPSDLNIGYKWVSLYGKDNRVDHCWFELKKHRGTTLVVWLEIGQDPNFHRIDHNYFTRPLLSTGNNEAETIRIGDSQRSLVNSNTIVEYNYFEECDGEIESISNKSCYNVYRYNTFFNNASILTLRHGHYCTVEGNYFFGNNASGSGGVRIIGVGHKVINNYMQDLAGSGNLRAPIVMMGGVNGFDVNDATNRYVAAQDNIVAFNTIVNCKQNIYIGSDKSSGSETYDAPFNNTIDNNIISNGQDNVLEFEYGEIASFSYAGNIYHNTTLGISNSGFTNTDPLLTSGTGLEAARLTGTSPAINAAAGNYNLTTDFDGENRTGTYDVGCDEYHSSTPLRDPLEKTEVGPCWMNPSACTGTPVVITDCHGDENGSALVDNCGVCSGGNTGITPNSTCSQDCNNEWNGTASIDNCGVCSGGSTGITADACLDCNAPFATHEDGLNVAANAIDNDYNTRWSGFGVGEYLEICLNDTLSLTSVSISFYKGNERATLFDIEISIDGINWTTIVSNGTSSGLSLNLEEFSFPSIQQAWKIRIIGNGNDSPSEWTSITEVVWNVVTLTNDCAGIPGGNASIDNCGVCSGGNTNITPNSTCSQDCNNEWNGTASIDNCGICSGGNTNITPNSTCSQDCNNEWNGTASIDNCGVCSGGNTNITPNSTCSQDCNNEWNGMASIDNCGVCSGGNTNVIPNSTCSQDCNNEWNGTASIDNCGVCSGGNTNITPNSTCSQDCNNEWNGTASIDNCGVCSGGTTNLQPNLCEQCLPIFATNNDGNLPENTRDNNLLTRWSAQGIGESIEYCLGDTLIINTINIAFYKGDERNSSFNLYTTIDGLNWNKVIDNQSSSGLTLDFETFTIPTSSIWKIRIEGLGNSVNDWNSLTEVTWEGIITGSDLSKSNTVTFYPNPTNGSIKIKSRDVIEEISLVTMLGTTINLPIQTQSELDVTLPQKFEGVGYLKIKTASGEVITKKIVKY